MSDIENNEYYVQYIKKIKIPIFYIKNEFIKKIKNKKI